MPRWLDKLLGRTSDAVEAPPASGALQAAIEQAQSMVRPAVALKAELGSNVPDGQASSLGGAPSLPDGVDWPTDGTGKPMVFVAQINYADMPKLDGYPDTGLLSVFVTDDDLFGCDFPSRAQKGFRTFFFTDVTNCTRRPPPEGDIYSPFGTRLMKEGAPLTGRLATGLPTASCHELDDIPTEFSIEEEDAFYEFLLSGKPGALYYGGYPDFVQSDIRSRRDTPSLAHVVLQLGFAHADQRDWMVCWGDAGEATLLISDEDLQARQFEKTVFNWDCG